MTDTTPTTKETGRSDQPSASQSSSQYPPHLSLSALELLTAEVKDYQLTHGSLLKHPSADTLHTTSASPVGVSLFPSPFPGDALTHAQSLAPIFGRLYAAVASDEDFLHEVLKDVIATDEFVRTLWEIREAAKREGSLQDVELGLWRSDYMLQGSDYDEDEAEAEAEGGGETQEEDEPWAHLKRASLRQVEFQTYATAGIAHGSIVGAMHAHLQRKSIYERLGCPAHMDLAAPDNHAFPSFVAAIAEAHDYYAGVLYPTRLPAATKTCVLIVVEPFNLNICDERPLEHALWQREPPIRTHRVLLGSAFLSCTSLDPHHDRRLLYTPPGGGNSDSTEKEEVALIYLRAGISPHEYNGPGTAARLRMETSRAIKCPSIATHLAGLKRVQLALSSRATLTRFLPSPADVDAIMAVTMPLHPLTTPTGRALALDPDHAPNHVLKPCREGGGNNVFGADIPSYLSAIPEEKWGEYILMRLIAPPVPLSRGVLMSRREVHDGGVVSEVGVCGVVLWRRSQKGERKRVEMLRNEYVGWTLKTKRADVDEMSVVKGYGCFDSIRLV